MLTLNRMLTLAIDDSSDDPDYGRALRGARLFMTITWVGCASTKYARSQRSGAPGPGQR